MEAQAPVVAAPQGAPPPAPPPPAPRTHSYFAPRSDARAEIAQAKAEMAVVLAESFREDINSLRDALQHANQLIHTIQAENASLRAALAHTGSQRGTPILPSPDEGTNNDNNNTNHANGEHGTAADDAVVNRVLLAEAQSFLPPPPPPAKPPYIPPRPDMQCPPPEGTIFCNGGPYNSAKTGERSNHNAQLKKELNDWTRARGYTVKIYRSRLEKKRAKLIISCVLAGRPTRVRSEEEEHQRREQALEGGALFRKQRLSKLSDCPLKFSLLEMVEGSGTFLVKHMMDPKAQHCNHEPASTSLDSDNDNQ